MVIIPKEKPVIENLNSYYLDVKRLLEHYQGELGSGGVHFKSSMVEGIVFFDKDVLLSGIYQDRDKEVDGKEAIDLLMEAVEKQNFNINVFFIPPEKVYFWANLPNSKSIYKELSTEFTDLDGLIRKMQTEGLTGYIDVSIGGGEDGGIIFFINGQVIDDSYCRGPETVNGAKQTQEYLVRKTKESGGVFNVFEITPRAKIQEPPPPLPGQESQPQDVDLMSTLEELMRSAEQMINLAKVKADFSITLKKFLVDRADEFPFLDPFAGEFEYSEGKIRFTGSASIQELASAIIDILRDMAEALGLMDEWEKEFDQWTEKYSKQINSLGISI